MAKEGNWSPGEKVPRTGTYKCLYCGPDGMGASVLKHAIRSMGIPYTPPASALKEPPQRFLKEGDAFPSCPNCKDDPSGLDTTGWEFVSEKEVRTATKTGGASTPEMVYFECTRPSGDGTCSDDSCPCGYPGANILRGSGYLYISKELVELRRDALSIAAIQKKVQRMQQEMGATTMMAVSGVFMPILMCELGAKKRGIDLAVAAADAKHWWKTGLAPLRPTRMAGKALAERCPKCGFSYKFNGTSCGHCGYSGPRKKHHVKGRHSTEPTQMVKFHCPGCGKLLNAPENLIGNRAKCPHAGCGKVVTVPSRAGSHSPAGQPRSPGPASTAATEQDPRVVIEKLAFRVTESSVEPPEGRVTDYQRYFLAHLRRGREQAVEFRRDFFADKPFLEGFLKDPVDRRLPNCHSLGIVFDWDKMESDYGRQVFEAFFHHVEPADLESQVVLHFGDLVQFDTFCALVLRGPSVWDIATVATKFGPAVNVPGLLPHEIRFLTADKEDGHLIARSFSLPISATIQSSRIAPDPQAGVEWMLEPAIKGTAWKL